MISVFRERVFRVIHLFETTENRLPKHPELHPCIIDIELPDNLVSAEGQESAKGISQSSASTVSHMKWACGVGTHKFHQNFFPAAGITAAIIIFRADDKG